MYIPLGVQRKVWSFALACERRMDILIAVPGEDIHPHGCAEEGWLFPQVCSRLGTLSYPGLCIPPSSIAYRYGLHETQLSQSSAHCQTQSCLGVVDTKPSVPEVLHTTKPNYV